MNKVRNYHIPPKKPKEQCVGAKDTEPKRHDPFMVDPHKGTLCGILCEKCPSEGLCTMYPHGLGV